MLKPSKLTTLSIVLFVAVLGLGYAQAAPPYQAEARLFPYSADGLTYGYVDETGAWAIEPQFGFAAEFVEQVAVVRQNDQYGYIDPGGTVVIAPRYDFAADFAFGLAPVAVEGEFGYIDQTGQMVVEPQFSDGRPFTAEGLAVVRSDQTYGFIDRSGQFVIEPQFESAFSFSEGLAAIVTDGQYGYIDDSGQVAIEPQFDFASTFSEGLAAVLSDGQMGFIDNRGQTVIEPAYDFAQDFSEGLAAVSVDGLTGFIDQTGQMVIEPQFNYAEKFSEGLAAVRAEELIGFIDSSGRMVIAPQFDEAGLFQDGLARVEWAAQWGIIDRDGTPRFQLPVAALSPASTLIIPFIPGVPAETRDGICLNQSTEATAPSAWRCVVPGDTPDTFAASYPCLVADDGTSLVCEADPLSGDPGFRVNLIEPLFNPPTVPGAQVASSNRAWLVQLADGTICRPAAPVPVNLGGQRATYRCSDGSVLFGELRPGTVWQANRAALADITQTDSGDEATQVNPAEIAVVWQPADPAAVLAEIGLSTANINIDPAGVAESVTPQIRPAAPYTPGDPAGLAGEPAHLRFAFDNEVLPAGSGIFPDQAQLLIYPLAAYRDLYREAGVDEVGQRLESLQALLQERPADVDEELPVLPGFGEAEQILHAQLKYLDFDGGAGVRFVTHYGVDATPITDQDTFYTFQGLTSDGRYLIVFFHPAPTDLLPGEPDEIAALTKDRDAFADNFETYRQDTRDQLDQAATTDFTPDLAALDAMIESMQIQPQSEARRVRVDSVEIQMKGSEYVATLTGQFPDSCATLGDVETAVTGETLTVTVYADSPPGMMCAAVLVPFEETITIDVSGIEPGDYTVVVNETATTTLTIN